MDVQIRFNKLRLTRSMSHGPRWRWRRNCRCKFAHFCTKSDFVLPGLGGVLLGFGRVFLGLRVSGCRQAML